MFKLDMSYDMYDREVYTIIGVFQAVGGFYNTLYFIMLFFHSQFYNSIFFSALIGKLYQVEASQSEEKFERRRVHHSTVMAKALKKDLAKGQVRPSLLIQIKEYLTLRRRISIRP